MFPSKQTFRDHLNPNKNIMQDRTQNRINSERNKVVRRQQMSIEAHISRLRGTGTSVHQEAASFPKKSSAHSNSGEAGPNVSRNSLCATVTNNLKKHIAARIHQRTGSTWLKAAAVRQYVDNVSVTTYTSLDDSDELSPQPNTGSERGSGSDTNQTSSCGCHGEEAKQTKALAQKLEVENTALQAKLDHTEKQLAEKNIQYDKQRAQRLNDYQKVQSAFEEQEASARRCEEEVNRYETQLQTKDDQIAELETRHKRAVSTIEERHQEDLALKDGKIAEANLKLQEKDEELTQAIKKAADERRELKSKSATEKRRLLKATKTNREDWAKEKELLKLKLMQQNADARDELQKRQGEIEQLTIWKHCVHQEMNVLHQAQHRSGTEQVYELVKESNTMRMELDKLRKKHTVLQHTNEDLLANTQRERDHFDKQYKEQRYAQERAHELQQKVDELEEKLVRRNELLGVFDAHGASEALLLAATKSDEVLYDNRALRKEVEDLLKKVNHADDEELRLSMEMELTEAQLHEAKIELQLFKEAEAVSEQQLIFLRNALDQGNSLNSEAKVELKHHLHDLTNENKNLRRTVLQLKTTVNEQREFIENVNDKAQIEVMKVQKEADCYYTMYWDEAVPKVERMHKEIRDLKRELGQDLPVQQHVNGTTAVEERAFLRHAAVNGVEGAPEHLVPPEVHAPNFQPGWIRATYNALRELRPLGYQLVEAQEKVYLAPTYEPFTEEDALARLNTRKHEGPIDHRVIMALPPQDGYGQPWRKSAIAPSAGQMAGMKSVKQSQSPQLRATAAKNQMQHVPTVQQMPKRPAAPRPAPAMVYESPSAPPYRESWLHKYKMSREDYEELWEENKATWVEMYVSRGKN
jgi:hypothetical protein